MPELTGRNQVARRSQRLDSVFEALSGANVGVELTAHYARYLCVLVSGFAEQSVKDLLVQHARASSHHRIVKYVGSQLKRFQNVDKEKLKQLIESFDPLWWDDLASKRADELDAFISIAGARNQIAHGGDAGITMINVRQYYEQIKVVINDLADVLDPAP